MSKMAEFKILIRGHTGGHEQQFASSPQQFLPSAVVAPCPAASTRAWGVKATERKSVGKANPRKAPAQRGLAAHHRECELCLGMPAPQQGPGLKKKREKKREKSSNRPRRGRRLAGVFSHCSWPGGAGEQEPCAKLPALRRLHLLPERHKTQHHERGEIFPGTSAAYPTGFTSQRQFSQRQKKKIK